MVKMGSVLMLMAALAAANVSAAERALECKTEAPFFTDSGQVETRFRIRKPLTDHPESDLNGLLDVTHDDAGLATYAFSNECDNMYEIVFFTKDLVGVLAGQDEETPALFRYSYAEPGFKDVVTVARCRAVE